MYSDPLPAPSRWRRTWRQLRPAARDSRTSYAVTRVLLLARIGALGNPLCYLLWHRVWPAEYESLPLRAVAMALCLLGLFARRFPRRWLDAYLVVALAYILPFFFTYMCLRNHAGPIWTESLLVSVVVVFHFDFWIAASAYLLGITAACAAVAAQGMGELLLQPAMLVQPPIHLFAIAVLSAARISRDALEQERLAGLGAGLATVSHELRTPLVSVEANVRGLLRQLAAGAGGPAAGPAPRIDSMDALARIQFEVRHMNHMIDLFLHSATAAERPLGPREQVSMAHSLEQMMRRYPFGSAAQQRSVAVEVRRDFLFAGQADLAVVVLLNLLRNALKAVQRAGKGRVRIIVDGARARPRLLFIDTGCGVAARHQALIFRRFYSHPRHQGTGIGLALCRDIVQAWDGGIRCVSRESAYAVFVLDFPRIPPR
ncbi:sensor histidine kinase [Oxalobacteraceae bacterium A2-2]